MWCDVVWCDGGGARQEEGVGVGEEVEGARQEEGVCEESG